MPYSLDRIDHTKYYKVINSQTGRVHSLHTTKLKGEKQIRLLEGIEHG